VSPIETSAIVFACVFGGSMLGMWLRGVVPEHHLSADSKDVIKLGVGLVGTMTALLLGLLVASSKGSFDTRRSELNQFAANAILLDRELAHYGTETTEIRGLLKISIGWMVDQTWPKDGKDGGDDDPQQVVRREVVFDKLQELVPRTDAQRTIQSQAENIMINMAQTRWLLFEQSGSSISTPFLAVVTTWLAILFISFGLFAPRNATVVAALLVTAISVAGAIFLILELDSPFSGLIQISSAPLLHTLAMLGK
jgi:hypothetical protein